MDRRDFLKATGSLVAGVAASPAITQGAGPASRTIFPINRNWRFSAAPSDAARGPRFDDAGFARVTLPHTNVRLPWHSFDEKSFAFVSVYPPPLPPARVAARPPCLRRFRRRHDGLDGLDQWRKAGRI